jgi:hypothetical protein
VAGGGGHPLQDALLKRFVVAEEERDLDRAADALGVAADLLAVSVQHFELVAHLIRCAGDVGDVGVFDDDAKRPLLAAAADEDRRVSA